MAGPGGGAFSVTVVPEGGGEPSRCFQLSPGEDRVIRIGRGKENDVAVELKGVSWVHAELRPRAANAEGGAKDARLLVRDLSTNGTGMRAPGATLTRLVKDADTPLPDGSTLILPLKVKAGAADGAKDMRASLLVLGLEQGKGEEGEAWGQVRGFMLIWLAYAIPPIPRRSDEPREVAKRLRACARDCHVTGMLWD
ncbi:unnamed protein product [Prorocentrum cordatum]|uniref:FHA domain-containing protein n=1 Tax=Prorocentrum cordatum TaxID=2364126 RepID=A0ABN9T8Z4_9DINO|nr:unnamed protein product [Polarella glacialis]